MLRHFILAISPLILSTTERPFTLNGQQYTLRVQPLPCSPGIACDTPFVPRRFRVEVLARGERRGYFEMPCVRVCEADRLARNVARAVGR